MLSDQQMQQRRGRITASVLPEIVGASPYRGQLAAWLKITGRHVDEPRDRDPRRWGHAVEASLVAHAAEHTGLVLDPDPGSLTHPDHDWFLATPDAVARYANGAVHAVVEAKNVNARVAARHWHDGPPDYVRVQVGAQMLVTGAGVAYVVASLGGEPPEVWAFDRSTLLHGVSLDELLEVAGEWYRAYVLTDEPPPPDEHDGLDAIAQLFPKNRGNVVALTDETGALSTALDAIGRYQRANEKLDEWTQEREQAQKTLTQLIGNRDGIEAGPWVATWKASASNGIDYRALVSHLFAVAPPAGMTRAELEEQFTRPGSRRFLLRDVKSKTTRKGGA